MSDAALPLPQGLKVEQEKDSGQFKVTVPVPPGTKKPTRVGVDPKTATHEILVDTGAGSNSDNHDEPPPLHPHETEQPERRRQPMPTQVVVQQPPAGGLMGWPATIANLSAVGFVLLLSFIMYNDFRGSVKEQNGALREDMIRASNTNDKNMQAITNSILTLSQTNTALVTSNNALVAEVRAGRLSSETKIEKLNAAIDKLTAIIDKKMP